MLSDGGWGDHSEGERRWRSVSKGSISPRTSCGWECGGILTSPLRYRHGEALMTECGVRLDHATIQRGVVQDSPLLEEALHRRTRPMLGFKAFEATQATLTGIERMHRLKKKQMVIEARDEGLTAAELFYSLAA